MPPVTLFRYIATQSLLGVGGLFIILFSLIVLIDLIENLRFAGKFADGSFALAAQLTVLRAPSLSQAFLPFTFLFGSIWMFNQLNRRSEISVMRSAGLSVWKLLGPAALIAALAGLFVVTVADPLAARMMSFAEQLTDRKSGAEKSLISVFDDGIWLRQRDAEMQLIINAREFDTEISALKKVSVWRFGPESQFYERIDADEAHLSGRTIELHDAQLKSVTEQSHRNSPLYAIPTALTPDDLTERVASPETLSIWALPKFILLAEAAGLPTTRYNIRFHDLCSTPLKLLAMVLIAAMFSVRPTRMGGVLQLIGLSIAAGFTLYILSEISTALGESGTVPVALSAWTPALVATLVAVTGLLHLEDG
ncbi:MAG: LPS export ABC transporter permease LptG [Pseudomonadota bacterium]